MILLNGVEITATKFPDKTTQVWKLPEEMLKCYSATITWQFSYESELLELAQLKLLLDKHRVKTNLYIEYLPYGRQDKDVSNTSTFALHVFANIINSLNFTTITIMDPHSEVALDLIKNSCALYPTTDVDTIVSKMQHTLICYPDKGALVKYSKRYSYPYIYGEKVREQLTGNITSYMIVGSCKNENILIVDDICDGGMTFKLLAKDLYLAGASNVDLFVTHGIFSKGIATVKETGINRIFTKSKLNDSTNIVELI